MNTGRASCEDEGRGQSNAAEAKERQKQPANHQMLGERHVTDSSLQTSEETNPSDTDFIQVACRTVRQQISVF